MENLLSIINTVGVVGATAISTITLFTTRALQRSQQKVAVMANKRSERIDLMREYSAGLISHGKYMLYDLETEDTKREMIRYCDKFISLLQYEYEHDVELIECARTIVKIALSSELDKNAMRTELKKFWRMCDVYVGVEYERLKEESMGDINGSGAVGSETKTFEDIYSILTTQQDEFLADDE